MSSQNQNYSYSSSASFSSFSSTSNGQTRSYAEQTHTDPSGTKVHRTMQEPGQPPVEERFQYDASGNRIEEAGTRGRIEDVTD
ncbi:hypothetical protein K469DRAFT_710900 [Zopfia rhizophila CBS 207.26]|uniref:Uncharacterized protein n=1 Tax=Zopfia rhizophila CBS 207.26 TaxID=1314779 RepID=A0A6A6DYP7_9PEZI|nr:hypothetical protein K469DRAFT_710900 [Zopfia rhizophila CBS 207.26]